MNWRHLSLVLIVMFMHAAESQTTSVADPATPVASDKPPECDLAAGGWVCKDPGKKYLWRPPASVRYVLIVGCGGGGSGTSGQALTSGAGGGGSHVRTDLLGPLTEGDHIEVQVGLGGTRNGDGDSSKVTFGKTVLTYPGGRSARGNDVFLLPSGMNARLGAAGGLGAYGTEVLDYKFDGEHAPPATNATGAAGQAGPYGAGGSAGRPCAAGNGCPGGGGGGGGVGIGGAGGNFGEPGHDGGVCSGGGGSGGWTNARDGREGGAGGPGQVLIYPLPDVNSSLSRTTELLQVVESRLNKIDALEKRVEALEANPSRKLPSAPKQK